MSNILKIIFNRISHNITFNPKSMPKDIGLCDANRIVGVEVLKKYEPNNDNISITRTGIFPLHSSCC